MNASIPRRIDEITWSRWSPDEIATLVFLRRDDDVLLIHKKRGLGAGKISGPGGRLEPGETPWDCAAREVQEELGVVPIGLRHHGEHRFQFVDGYGLHVHVFTANAFRGEPRETDEAIPRWTPVDRIPFDEMWEDDRLWLPQVLAGQTIDGRWIFDGDRMVDHTLHIR